MEELAELKQELARQRPDDWDGLPDIPLYMDQVVSYLSRQIPDFGDGDALTPAMINTYIKDGLPYRHLCAEAGYERAGDEGAHHGGPGDARPGSAV